MPQKSSQKKSTHQDSFRQQLPMIHPEGWIRGIVFALLALLIGFWSLPLGLVGVILTVWCFAFFRNPDRVVPKGEGLVVSPADGRICLLEENVPLPPELHEKGKSSPYKKSTWTRISIFMNVFDVHVNRVPTQGKITHASHHSGQFLNASLKKASEENERQTLMVHSPIRDTKIAFIQIAGLIARRIRCDLAKGDTVKTGERFGIICFGSRVDVYLPKGIQPQVIQGQTVVGGETLLADLKNNPPKRQGIVC